MVSGINANVGFQGGINTATNARPYMNQPYQYTVAPQVAADTVEIAGKKKGGAVKKGIIGTVIGLAVAAAALYAGTKSGKITEVANATKWTEKLQNLAYKGGKGVEAGVEYVTKKGGDLVDWIKDKFSKKAPENAGATVLAEIPNTAPSTPTLGLPYYPAK